MKKCIIAGSRRIPALRLNEPNDWWVPEKRKKILTVLEIVIQKSGFEFDAVISGHCWGIDQLGEEWGETNSKTVFRYPADWSKGHGAGFARNQQMSEMGDMLICLHSKDSRGSLHMIGCMKNKPTFVFAF